MDNPNTTTLIIIAVIVIVVVLAAIVLFQRRRSEQLRSRFGPEYQRAVEETGDRRKAESELQERAKRVEKLDIRPLTLAQRQQFTDEWQRVQAKFVDDPERSIDQADRLLQDVMTARGYPVQDFDQVAADISVDHPTVVQNYRAGHEIAVRHSHGKGDTEDLRKAMIHYRELFAELVTEGAETERETTSGRTSDDTGTRARR
jgi:hypothetical protein